MAFRPVTTFLAGALLATGLSVTGMQAWEVGAAPGDTDTTYVPLEPCRLLDTRASATQGERRAPLAAGETFTAQVTGTNGDCVGIPADATAVALNVTSINPTARSFLTLYPADQAVRPTVSSLNWVADQPPAPNKVDVKLSDDGAIKLFNNAGDVGVFIDVAGYYSPSSLSEIDARLIALELPPTTVINRSGFELQPSSPDSGWSYQLGTRHSATGFAECVFAPVDVKPGQTVTEITVNIASDAPVTFRNSGLLGVTTDTGTFASEEALIHTILAPEFVAPPTGAGTVASVELAPLADTTIRADYLYTVQVCTADALDLIALTVTLDNP